MLFDPFSEDGAADWAAAVAALRANGNQVGAYVGVGTGEDWREDFGALRPFLVTTPWNEWGGEDFVTSTEGALPLREARIDRVAAWGFDWVEFDNMDWAFDDEARAAYGFAAAAEDGVLCESWSGGMGWWDETGARDFARAGKPVIVVHYGGAGCGGAREQHRAIYGDGLSFLCEDADLKRYVRFDEPGRRDGPTGRRRRRPWLTACPDASQAGPSRLSCGGPFLGTRPQVLSRM